MISIYFAPEHYRQLSSSLLSTLLYNKGESTYPTLWVVTLALVMVSITLQLDVL